MHHHAWILVAAAGICGAAYAEHSGEIPAGILAAVAEPHRPPEQRQLDALRKPARLIAFAGLRAGDRVADFMPGNAYFTRILSKAVGSEGRVYAFIPEEEIKNCKPEEIAGSRAIEHDPAYANVVRLSGPVNRFSVPRKLDVLWTAQNYHDLHDSFLQPADIKLINKAFYNALKPGGVFIVIDHAAALGSGLRDTETLHRIDPSRVRQEIEAAGFVFESKIDDVSNQEDDHTRSVFDPAIRGRTDQFVFKFRRPAKPQ
jgi:predicted methyltransferase